MYRRQALVAYPQTTELVQPGDGAFHHPSRLAQAAAVRGAALSDLGLDSFLGQDSTQRPRMVCAVGLNQCGFTLWCARPPRYGRNGLNQWQQLRDIVSVGAGEDQRKRDTLGIRE